MKIRGSIVLPCMGHSDCRLNRSESLLRNQDVFHTSSDLIWFTYPFFISIGPYCISEFCIIETDIWLLYLPLYLLSNCWEFFFLIFDRERVWYLYVLFFPQLIRRSLSFAFGQYISKQRSTFLETEKKMGEEF